MFVYIILYIYIIFYRIKWRKMSLYDSWFYRMMQVTPEMQVTPCYESAIAILKRFW